MAKWKSQQLYTVHLTDVLASVITLTPDMQIPNTRWYWGGEADIVVTNRAMTGTISSLTEEVLPYIQGSKDGNKVRAMLPIQNVTSFERETGLSWNDGLSWSALYSTVKRVYNL